MVLSKKLRTSRLYIVFTLIVGLLCAPSANADVSAYFPLKLYSYNSKIPLTSIAEYRKDNVRYIGDEDDWVNVQVVGGIPAWLKKSNVSLSADSKSASVVKPSARIYISPKLDSRYLVTINYGHRVNVIEDAGDWVQVNTPDNLGLKVRKLDYDRIYPRFGNTRTNAVSSVIPNAQTSVPKVNHQIVNRRPTTNPQPRTATSYSQSQIQNLPDAVIRPSTTVTTTASSIDAVSQRVVISPSVSNTQPYVSATTYQPSLYANSGLADYRLTPGDVVSISVFGEPDMVISSAKIPVNGFVSFPLVGQVFVAGKTPSQVESTIESSLAGGYLSDPKVNLSIDVYRPVYVRGAVYSPGSYDYNIGLTVAKILTTAGGSTKEAIKDSVKLYRNNSIYLENLNVDSQELIHPGDIVSVEERPEEIVVEEPEPVIQYIYMHGEVKSPGEYEYREGLTIEKAVALAGGFGPRASKKRIDISREVEGVEEPEKISRVKLYFDLQPGDVVHVGESWF